MNDVLQNEANSSGVFAAHQPNSPSPKTSRAVHLINTEVMVFTRRGHDGTKRYKKIAYDAWHINAGSAIMDGEILA